MDTKLLARLGAIIFVAVAATAAVVEATRRDPPPLPARARFEVNTTNPLRDAQRRCQQLGQAAAADEQCLKVWAETRDRFLGRPPTPLPPSSTEGR